MKISIEAQQLKQLSKGIDEFTAERIIKAWLENILDYAYLQFVEKVPIYSGRTLNAVYNDGVTKIGNIYTGDVGVGEITPIGKESPKYPLFVHEGTGIYGPSGSPIVALPGNIFAFEKEGEGTIFTRYVSGVKGMEYLSEIEDNVTNIIRLEKRALLGIMKQQVRTVIS